MIVNNVTKGKSSGIKVHHTHHNCDKGGQGIENPGTNSNVVSRGAVVTNKSSASVDPSLAKKRIVDNPILAKNYADEVKNITGKAVTPEQRALIKYDLQSKEFVKLDKVSKDAHRKQFNSKLIKLRAEWEQKTGQPWPKYVTHSDLDKIGKAYDAHHIIPVSHGGPNEWCNIYPANSFLEHNKIHGSGSTFRGIFNAAPKSKLKAFIPDKD